MGAAPTQTQKDVIKAMNAKNAEIEKENKKLLEKLNAPLDPRPEEDSSRVETHADNDLADFEALLRTAAATDTGTCVESTEPTKTTKPTLKHRKSKTKFKMDLLSDYIGNNLSKKTEAGRKNNPITIQNLITFSEKKNEELSKDEAEVL